MKISTTKEEKKEIEFSRAVVMKTNAADRYEHGRLNMLKFSARAS